MNISELIAEYIKLNRGALKGRCDFFAQMSSLSDAIRCAANCMTDSGKKHSHQRRIPIAVLKKAEQKLLKHEPALLAAKDFDVLYKLVDAEAGSISGIGELTVYDIALCIGAFRGIEPDKVYLHAGTRIGAKKVGLSGKVVDMGRVRPSFPGLTPAEIEDFLCIYKGRLGGAKQSVQSPVRCINQDKVSSCSTTQGLRRSCC